MEEITIIVDDLTEEVVLGNSTAVTEAPSDGSQYARKDKGWSAIAGGGDMSKSTYDPTNANGDSFAYANFTGTPTTITAQQTTDITTNNSKVGVTNEEVNTINTELEAGMTGEDLVLNVLSLTTAEHTAGTKIATTLYLITDA